MVLAKVVSVMILYMERLHPLVVPVQVGHLGHWGVVAVADELT